MNLKNVSKLIIQFVIMVGVNSGIAEESKEYTIAKPSTWVATHKVVVPDITPTDKIKNGIYYLLIDKQARVTWEGKYERFTHFAEKIVNPKGLEYASQILIDFDPIYENLTLHSINIIRSGKIIRKLLRDKVSLIQREKDLDKLIYNGLVTANIILDDVRVGDVVEYSYSRTGSNPVFNNIYSYEAYFQWSVPVHRQLQRILWEKDKPLTYSAINDEVNVKKSHYENGVEYKFEVVDSKIINIENKTPDWYNPYGYVLFSELNSWEEVVDWALPLYTQLEPQSAEFHNIITEINLKAESSFEKVAQALQFTQNEVRYLGLELGSNSHKPSLATETLARRYGDCKDKAVLLVRMLKEMGYSASPALVNTDGHKSIGSIPPSINAFNHVIVVADIDGESFWLDPTWRNQYGGIDKIYQPNYGYALVVEEGVNKLRSMDRKVENSLIKTKDQFDVSSGEGYEATFKSTTVYQGADATRQRNRLEEKGLAGLQEIFLMFYRGYYPDLTWVEKSKYENNENDNEIHLVESYKIKNIWDKKEGGEKRRATFYANLISDRVQNPDFSLRKQPLEISYPDNLQQIIEVLLPSSDWDFEAEEVVVDNAYFYYKSSVKFDNTNNLLSLQYRYESKDDHISAADFVEYRSELKKVRDDNSYSLWYSPGSSKSLPAEDALLENGFIEKIDKSMVILSMICLLLVYVIVEWLVDRKRTGKSSLSGCYYPVSMLKLTLLSVVTFGCYPVFYFYKNWQFIKRKNQSHIIPAMRALLNGFFYYSFYKILVNDSNTRYQENKLPPIFIGGVLALLYFLLYILSGIDAVIIPCLLIAALLLLPLANYINHIEGYESKAYVHNSKWRPRHYLLCLLFLPLASLMVGESIGLLPSDRVVLGRQVLERDIRFMVNQGCFPANEKLRYFYSDAFLDIRDDGNGFTENTVFSYWLNGDGKLVSKSADLSAVKDLEVSYASEGDSNSTITVKTMADEEFVLYVSSEQELDRRFIQHL
ncbi:MAG: transglutaminase-like putative cysteine protease, partial [Pseudohongiellaceae bacterium]